MFPGQFVFYDKEMNEIRNDSNFMMDLQGKPYENQSDPSMLICKKDTFIPLASTGLEDQNGDEIFEGNIVEIDGGLSPVRYLIHWQKEAGSWWHKSWDTHGCYKSDYPCGVTGVFNQETADESKLIGHALNDPDLVPDVFNVESYFNLNGDGNSGL
jgi:hypothetical protein